MTHRTITRMSNGHVLVLTHVDGVTAIEMREYKRRGTLVYLIRDEGPPQPVCRELRTTGEPLLIRPGEDLEAAIRRELDVRDGKRRRSFGDWYEIAKPWIKRGLGWASGFVLLLAVLWWLSQPMYFIR